MRERALMQGGRDAGASPPPPKCHVDHAKIELHRLIPLAEALVPTSDVGEVQRHYLVPRPHLLRLNIYTINPCKPNPRTCSKSISIARAKQDIAPSKSVISRR